MIFSNWLSLAFQLQGSVAPIILPRVLLFGILSTILVAIHKYYPNLSFKMLSDLSENVVYNLVLGLLLVFRTNSAYDRYWEGRKAWGQLVFNIRNLTLEIKNNIITKNSTDHQLKETKAKLLTAFVRTTKQHLRSESVAETEITQLLTESEQAKLKTATNSPLQIIIWIREYLHQQYQNQKLDLMQLIAMNGLINNIIEGLTSCERIRTTPIPIAYTIYLRRLIIIYCITLPFSFIEDTGWYTGLCVAIISFILLGMEQIGHQLEDPFGHDPNDLPIEQICENINQDVTSIIQP